MANPRVAGKNFEYRCVRHLRDAGFENAYRVPVSGASQLVKGDVFFQAGDFLRFVVECKKTMKKSFQMDINTLNKIGLDAKSMRRKPLLFHSYGRSPVFVTLRLKDFLEILNKVVWNEF